MRLHHFGLEVTNLEDSIKFYTDLLGLEMESRHSFLGEDIAFLASGHFRLELVYPPQSTHSTHLCFEVSDLQQVIKTLGSDKIAEGPYKLDTGWETVFYEGPNHEVIEFLQLSPPHKAGTSF
ncbi:MULTISPECIES: VOC family protein [unclassified Bacillus (in: firmicutes)]|uniref:VOC family protein n=1 Tax=unclassified Bacillus (in: firmicutes) TaxID=185979 RepID=UPI001BE72773|nr:MULTISPECIES: VOC family protein [unclassified Bacillus (in: firmicutes)]MBT2639908.1 VOC family protein [Bacillus sp. ISL-39]MBT2663629.1 VOC family protein [Bacillus sp. ISL-45]